MKNSLRTEENKRDTNLESLLKLLNSVLEDDEKQLTEHLVRPKYPPIFIVGNPRSGTTLIYQWLASTGQFSYPSNIISRFYNAPYIGALIHKAFVDYDKFGEILGSEKITFRSRLGKTTSAISPHEFWYFWRRFFKFDETHKLTESSLQGINSKKFIKELAALESAFDKPLLMKAMILNWNLDYLEKILPESVFLHVKRDPIMNMHSLYNARIKYFGDVTKWYSFKPPEYEDLKKMNVYEQLAGQVLYTERVIDSYLNSIRELRLIVNYEDFCKAPQELLIKIGQKFEDKGLKLEQNIKEASKFNARNKITNDSFSLRKAQKALEKIKDELVNL